MENDTLSHYHSKTQFKLFWGEFVKRPMHDSQWIDWVFLDGFPLIKDFPKVPRYGLAEGYGVQAQLE